MECDLLRLFVLVLVVCLLWYWHAKRQKKEAVALPVSDIRFFSKEKSVKGRIAHAVQPLFWVAALLTALALSDPRKIGGVGEIEEKPLPSRKGIGIYFLLDQSGSMEETVATPDGRVRKIALAQKAIREFVEGSDRLPGRANDLLGLVAFARVANIVCPLTLDRPLFLSKLAPIEPITEERLNGTSIGYAIFKTVVTIQATKYFAERLQEQAKPVYAIKNQVIIIVTDGLQSPNPADKNNPFRYMGVEDAFVYAKENGVRVYYIGVDPILGMHELAGDVNLVKKGTRETGGEFFLATSGFPIEDIFSKIDALEKSELPEVVQEKPRGQSLIPQCVALILLCLFLAMLGETVYVRSFP